MSRTDMREFWDARAREDAYFFVDDRRGYGDLDAGRFWENGERDLDRIFALLGVGVKPSDVVLDLGCGIGRMTRVLAQRAATVYGLDVSSEMLDRARNQHAGLDNIHWVQGDGVSLAPLQDGSVDACVSHVVFQHIPDPGITLGYVREMGRVLRPRGWAAFQVSNDPDIHRPRRPSQGFVQRLRSLVRRHPSGQDDPAWLGSAVDLEDLREVADQSGLALERIEGAGTQFCMILARRRGD